MPRRYRSTGRYGTLADSGFQVFLFLFFFGNHNEGARDTYGDSWWEIYNSKTFIRKGEKQIPEAALLNAGSTKTYEILF